MATPSPSAGERRANQPSAGAVARAEAAAGAATATGPAPDVVNVVDVTAALPNTTRVTPKRTMVAMPRAGKKRVEGMTMRRPLQASGHVRFPYFQRVGRVTGSG